MDPTTREQLRAVLNKLPDTGEYAPIRRKIVTMIKLAKKVEKLEKEADKAEREADAAQRLLEATRAEVRQKEAELADMERQPESSAMAAQRERHRPRKSGGRRSGDASECGKQHRDAKGKNPEYC